MLEFSRLCRNRWSVFYESSEFVGTALKQFPMTLPAINAYLPQAKELLIRHAMRRHSAVA
jgi:hypothetical protein